MAVMQGKGKANVCPQASVNARQDFLGKIVVKVVTGRKL
jgi:hypothetical protein